MERSSKATVRVGGVDSLRGTSVSYDLSGSARASRLGRNTRAHKCRHVPRYCSGHPPVQSRSCPLSTGGRDGANLTRSCAVPSARKRPVRCAGSGRAQPALRNGRRRHSCWLPLAREFRPVPNTLANRESPTGLCRASGAVACRPSSKEPASPLPCHPDILAIPQ